MAHSHPTAGNAGPAMFLSYIVEWDQLHDRFYRKVALEPLITSGTANGRPNSTALVGKMSIFRVAWCLEHLQEGQ